MESIIKKINDKRTNIIKYINSLDIKILEKLLAYLSNAYYNDVSLVSDKIFDIISDVVKEKNPTTKHIKNVGAKVIKNKVKLNYWLGSMNKFKSSNNKVLEAWKQKYTSPYIISDKLDGVSALLTYSDKINLSTRGDGNIGFNINKLLDYIKYIPSLEEINNYCNANNIKGKHNTIAFRGELLISKKEFTKWSNEFKNSRNLVSGVVNSKYINEDIAKDIFLVVYEIVDPVFSIEMQYNIISTLNLILVPYFITNDILDYSTLKTIFSNRKIQSEYYIDGIIVSANKYIRNTSNNPDYAFAFKELLEEESIISTVTKVEWKISKDGVLIPTVHIEPTILNGIKITKTTGYNAKYIQDNIIGKGSIIEIIRSGDVIPIIKKIISPSTTNKPDMPHEKYKWNEANIDILLVNLCDNKNYQIKNIYRFFSFIKTKGLGEKIIEKLYMNGLTTIIKILNATIDDLIKIEGIKEKSAENIINSVKAATKNISLSQLMVASNSFGKGFGIKKIQSLISTYPNILLEYKKWTKEDFILKLNELNNWDDKTSINFIHNFNNFISFYEDIQKYIKISKK